MARHLHLLGRLVVALPQRLAVVLVAMLAIGFGSELARWMGLE